MTIGARKPRPLYARVAQPTVAALLIALLPGCSDKVPTYPAGGKVTFADGKPLTDGWVHFRSQSGDLPTTSRGLIQPDGTFKLTTFQQDDGAVEGKHQALVTVTFIEGQVGPPSIDRRFSDFSKSGLKFTVTTDPAKNNFPIEVTPPRR